MVARSSPVRSTIPDLTTRPPCVDGLRDARVLLELVTFLVGGVRVSGLHEAAHLTAGLDEIRGSGP